MVTNIRSSVELVARGLALHYGRFPVVDNAGFADFHVSVDRPCGLRRLVHPQVHFRFDREAPFNPLPAPQAFPMLEWGLNWCVSNYCHQYLILHAAVVERHGMALILPAPPGSGKSTLCAGLVNRGWRLLSDELTMIDPAGPTVAPIPRPVSLKNASIEAIRDFAPAAVLGPVVHDTVKGSVAHMQPPVDSVSRASEHVVPRWVVMPRYQAGSDARLDRLSRARGFMHLSQNAFNYNAHGRRGFELLARVTDLCEFFEFTYSRLEEAEVVFSRLANAAVMQAVER